MSEHESGARVVMGQEAALREEERSRQFLLSFGQLLQVSGFHALDNAALVDPLESVSRMTRRLAGQGKKLHFFINEEQIFVNRKRIRFSLGTYRKVRELVGLFQRKGLAGFEIQEPLSSEALRRFLRIFHSVGAEVENPAERLKEELSRVGSREIVLIRSGRTVRAGGKVLKMDEDELAALLYAKAVVILRVSLRRWEDEQQRNFLGARARRVIQHIITRAEKDPRPYLWLANVKEEDEYLYTHSTNVALLSILMGLKLGLNRNRVCDLGMAALFHDVGQIRLPPRLLNSSERFTESELKLLKRHPIHGLNLLLGLGRLNEPLLQRLIVVFEYNIDTNGYPRSSWPGGLHIFSRIVAIADAYDAMTTRRHFRAARTPSEAMRELFEGAGTRYDEDLVKVLANVVGVYPLGTLVLLDTGEAGLVYHVDPATPRHPLVKIVRDADGVPLTDGPVVELTEPGEDGEYLRTIIGTDDPARHGIHVPSHIAESIS